MKLTQLRYFQGICRWGSLSRAARELHISQSVLSGTIKELEEEFGVLLFSRSGRGLVLTKEGEFFLGEAESLLDHADQVEESMRQFKNAGQTVHLGVSPMLSVLLFPRLLARFQRAFPAAKLELTEGGSLANMAGAEEAAAIGGRAFLPLYCKMRPGKNPIEKSEEKFGKIEG